MARTADGPNWVAKLLLVALRVAIGWHLCYEGLCKLDPHWASLMRDKEPKSVTEPFSAEGYLRNATGPLRGHFRNMIPDVDGVRKLDARTLEEDWRATTMRFVQHYKMDDAARKAAEAKIADLVEGAKAHYADEKVAAKVAKYKADLDSWLADDATDRYGGNLELRKRWQEIDATRRDVTREAVGWSKELEQYLNLALTPAQASEQAPLSSLSDFKQLSQLEQASRTTKWGLTIAGGCMIVGLFSRLSSLAGAGFLALFYLSLPPWPGLPMVPGTEGNYLIVNKNLVEMIACLALAAMPTGAWGGIDAFVRGLITRPLLGVGAAEVIDRARGRSHDDDDD